ncbi:hypothetical protein [Nonomuraea typhae]|uniref:hypothetical protein n=1 Tax=Nonomuraea typhae TaxID=2603600 RepID=UPI0015E1CB34|nr:hypothetical protein [Nonomuraea typhae]
MTAPAQAAPKDPVAALKKQFVAGHGVRVAETVKIESDGRKNTATTTGVLAFGKSGVVASDLRLKGKGGAGLGASRTISVKGHTFLQGGIFGENLPEGKKWVRYPSAGASPLGMNQLIDVFQPKVLKTVLAKAKPGKGDVYRGSITMKDLTKASGGKITGRFAKVKIDYLVDLDSRGLVSRVTSTVALDFGLLGTIKSTADSRYTAWGARVTVKAPPKDQWIDFSELGPDSDLPESLPEDAITSLGQGR